MRIAKLLLRVTVGALFVGHGTQKLFGWFGGYGLQGTSQGFDSMGMRPGKHHAIAAGVAEAGGGAALALGAATPVASAALTATMITAINRVHLKNGPWASNGGYEYNLILIAVALLLAEDGPGSLSLDAATGHERTGPLWGLFALGAGAVGALGAHRYAEAHPAPEETQDANPNGAVQSATPVGESA